MKPEVITVSWRNGAYYVDKPNWNGGDVVSVEAYDRVKGEMIKALDDLIKELTK